ncbi:mannitol dehydrogenase family protein [Sphingomonas morindae]|uniref:Mannitol dehydrogenase family protein n=1 Tax=Sphingomonas morindae TaxID=1541170 RepID=A0ABY4X6G9_9SPHN|nr:mannitol dehydrogenase family protein [Sphingomonas morindae]USI72439.1 mannitol dehydrogenase family protein [Sphingomonas morindae]
MRLADATLAALPAEIARPGYDRAAMRTGVVHLGIGAFHRAHQAAVFEAALAGGDPRWAITGVSLRAAGVRDQLAPQDGLYTLIEREGATARARVIGAVRQVLVAPEAPQAVVAALAAADTRIVTLTITEKGYAAAGDSLSAPVSAAAYLAAGLAARRAAGLAPLTVISCDNLPDNGARLAAEVRAVAERHDPALARWIEAEIAFPQTMVDRIVPATDAADIAGFEARAGVTDLGLVKTEPFLQWVVEDRFSGPRPDLAALGVQLTETVGPWEDAKLRLLNGAHSAIAYLGGLAGIATVDQVVALPEARRFVERLWDEAGATLTPPPGLDLHAYRAALMARFANAALAHGTRQIAMDGSQKLPQRLLASIGWRIARDLPIPALALAVAAWMRWQGGRDDQGAAFVVDDPRAADTAAALRDAGSAEARVRALAALPGIVPPALASDPRFIGPVAAALERLERGGARAALAETATEDAA